jgi:NAD(P)-dependent dehydrogenase (short-subunit alcohol dehydrogenase family)
MAVSASPVALVTGGLRGIGLGIASALAKSGFSIAITDLSDPESESPGTIIKRLTASGTDVIYLQSDLADIDTHRAAIDSVISRFGRLDCLVNNAAWGP